jgi:hypothetical protein
MPWQPSAGLNIAGNESKIGSNLKGSSTSNELMSDVRFVLGGFLVLDRVRSTPRSTHRKGQAHFVVSRSVLVVFAEPTHDDDICKVGRDE